MTPEHRLMNQIRLYASEQNWLVIRNNVGKFRLADGRFFDTGLPKGWPDLMILVGQERAVFVETKIKPRKPTKIQIERLNRLKSLGYHAFVCYELSEFVQEMSIYLSN